MATLRTRLILAFVVATIVPVAATVWVASSLLDQSLAYATTTELERVSRALEDTARRFYQHEREALRTTARDGRVDGTFTLPAIDTWPEDLRAFWDSAEAERFIVTGARGDALTLMRRTATGVSINRRPLGLEMETLATEVRRTREVIAASGSRDLRRGLTRALAILIALVWMASLVPLIFIAYRISRPIRHLTAGLTDLAAGDWTRRVDGGGADEVGRAIDAFNRMAERLQQNRDRLVYLTQMASWQLLARKTAHELKNSLTPIRLTVEELVARQPASDRAFVEQAAQIVIAEIETLERRVRAFSEFATEPPVRREPIDVNAAVTERLALLAPAHPATTYVSKLDDAHPRADASADLLKGILTNLLDNAADAAGAGGRVLVVTRRAPDGVAIEVHDSGPGLSAEAAATLFEPTITFKKGGMGLGLSIARKNALLCGGDITLIGSELGGAGFRVLLPPVSPDSTMSRS